MGDIYDEITYRIDYDFANEETRAISVYMGFLHTPVGEVRAGLLEEPLSLEDPDNLTATFGGLTIRFQAAF